jgi:hypothetical protein
MWRVIFCRLALSLGATFLGIGYACAFTPETTIKVTIESVKDGEKGLAAAEKVFNNLGYHEVAVRNPTQWKRAFGLREVRGLFVVLEYEPSGSRLAISFSQPESRLTKKAHDALDRLLAGLRSEFPESNTNVNNDGS